MKYVIGSKWSEMNHSQSLSHLCIRLASPASRQRLLGGTVPPLTRDDKSLRRPLEVMIRFQWIQLSGRESWEAMTSDLEQYLQPISDQLSCRTEEFLVFMVSVHFATHTLSQNKTRVGRRGEQNITKYKHTARRLNWDTRKRTQTHMLYDSANLHPCLKQFTNISLQISTMVYYCCWIHSSKLELQSGRCKCCVC